MEEPLDGTIPKGKVFKEKTVLIGTLLGGPLVTGYFFAENFKVLNHHDKVNSTWIITILISILIFSGILFIPDDVNIPNQLFPIAYTAVGYALFKMFQAQKVSEHIIQGGPTHGWGRMLVVVIIATIISVASVFGLGYAFDSYEQSNIVTKTYGTEVVHEIDYNKNNISAEEIDKIANGFVDSGYFEERFPKYAYVEKKGNKYEISLSVVEGLEDDAEGRIYFLELRDQMDAYLPENDVQFKLVVDYLDNVVLILN